MKYLIILFCCLTPICVYSQIIDSITFSRLSKELLEKDHFLSLSKEDVKHGLVNKNNCISIKGEDYTVGCVTSSWDKSWVTDFNRDSIMDLIVKTRYWGPDNYGDGIVNNIFNILILDKQRNMIKSYPLYGGGLQGSGGGLLHIDSLKNGHIHTSLLDNELDMNKRLNLEFFLKNGRLQEKKYLKCKLYTSNKKIFKKEI